MIDGEMTQQCCLLLGNEIGYRQPGNQTLYHIIEAKIKCEKGWTGHNCDSCARNYGPAGLCDRCLTGWAGENCSECAIGWTGPECSSCATNFGPPGQCDSCLAGWTGDNCDVCGFGFSTESNCTECIQNGLWEGTLNGKPLEIHLTFTGESCSQFVPGSSYQGCLFYYFIHFF